MIKYEIKPTKFFITQLEKLHGNSLFDERYNEKNFVKF